MPKPKPASSETLRAWDRALAKYSLHCGKAPLLLPTLVGEDGNIVYFMMDPLVLLERQRYLSKGAQAALRAARPSPSDLSERIRVNEFELVRGTGHYEVELLSTAGGSTGLRASGGGLGEDMYGGRADLPEGVSVHGRVTYLPNARSLAEGLRYEIAKITLPGGHRILALVEQSTRVGETVWGLGVSIGASAGAAVEIPGTGSRPLRFHLLGGPSYTNLRIPTSLPLDSMVAAGFDYTW